MNAYALEADMYDQWLSVKGIAEYKTLAGQLGFRPYVGGEHLIDWQDFSDHPKETVNDHIGLH